MQIAKFNKMTEPFLLILSMFFHFRQLHNNHSLFGGKRLPFRRAAKGTSDSILNAMTALKFRQQRVRHPVKISLISNIELFYAMTFNQVLQHLLQKGYYL